MNGSLNSFNDSLERDLFVDVLCDLKRQTSKNIWVICEGEKTGYSMEREIRYLFLSNDWIDNYNPLEVATETNYLLITATEKEVSYEVKRLF